MPVGGNFYRMRLERRAECSPPTPHFTTTASETPCSRWSSASGATCSPDRSTPIAAGSNANGRYAREREHKKDTENTEEERNEIETRYAFRFRAYWFVLAQTEGQESHTAPIPGFDIDLTNLTDTFSAPNTACPGKFNAPDRRNPTTSRITSAETSRE